MNDLSLEEIANYTGRSLSTFKRDFRKYSNLSPQKWLIQRRLEAAHELIRRGGRRVPEISAMTIVAGNPARIIKKIEITG